MPTGSPLARGPGRGQYVKQPAGARGPGRGQTAGPSRARGAVLCRMRVILERDHLSRIAAFLGHKQPFKRDPRYGL